uniref:Neur_chan_LBD domain-containing protein n=1 Tax=Brugia timori TaxID=42155 RepID=A0A0R3R9F4_9BILA
LWKWRVHEMVPIEIIFDRVPYRVNIYLLLESHVVKISFLK